jgi:hypothetical protein|tara:strand:- start:288 stop:395 length:108 start_codon:yes stop_codon:yes gene_type:complete
MRSLFKEHDEEKEARRWWIGVTLLIVAIIIFTVAF